MNVVTRSLMAAGLLMYAGIHFLQVPDPPPGAPGWLRLAFLATAIVAVVLGAGLLFREAGHNQLWKDAAALLAAVSAVALVVFSNLDVAGVDPMGMQSDAWGALAAEAIILASWVAARMVPRSYNEVDA